MLRRKREFIQALICIALLFAAPILISAPALRRGDLPINLDALTTRAPWQEARLPGREPAQTSDFVPAIDRYYPWYAFISEAAANGEIPLWNPYEGFGAPFLALWRTRALSPFSAPLYSSLPLHAAIGISVFLKILVAGLSAYFAARRFHFAPPYALLAAITYQTSGLLLTGHWHPASDVIPWLPLLLPCVQRVLLGDYRFWPYMATIVGVMALGGDPETLAGILLFLLVLTPIYSMRTYTSRHLFAAFSVVVFTIAVGLLLAAVQVAPYIEFTRHGILEGPPLNTFRAANFAMLLAPAPHSNITDASMWLPAGIIGVLLVPLWLAVRPFANRIRRRRLEALLFATATVLAVAFISVSLLRRIPAFSHIDVWHFAAPYPLALGLLAATASTEWVHLDADKCKSALKTLVWLLPIFWGGLFAGTLVAMRGAAYSSVSHSHLLTSAVVAFAVLILLLGTAIRPKPTVTAYTLTAMAALCAWWVYTPGAIITPAQQVFPETHFIRTLHNQDSRIAGTARLKQWPLSVHQIAQTHSPSGVTLHRSARFMHQAGEQPDLLRLTGARTLLLTKHDIKGGFSSLRPVLNIQEVFPSGAILLKDLQAHERARVVHAGRALDAAASPQIRATGPPLIEGGTLPTEASGARTASAAITHDAFNAVTLDVSSTLPGVLTLADAWYPGWHVTVDDASGHSFPVDLAFRGVEIGDGAHEVTFFFSPFSLQLGALISLGAFLVVAGGFASLYRNRRRA